MSWLFFTIAAAFYSLSQKRVFAESDEWKNKYKQPLEPAPKTKYYKLTGLKYKERFPLSGSLLVAFTDKYHAYQLGFKAFICAAVVTYKPLLGYWDWLVLFVVFGVVLTLIIRR